MQKEIEDMLTSSQIDLDTNLEIIVDYAVGMGIMAWVDKVNEMVDSTDNAHAQQLLRTAGLMIIHKVAAKCRQLEELENG